MSFAALLVSFTVAQQKFEKHSPGFSFQSWFELFLVRQHRDPDLSGLAWPRSALPEALTLAHRCLWKTRPWWNYRLLWPYLFWVSFFFMDAPTLCSGGSPAGFRREAHRGSVVQSQQDPTRVKNRRHLCSPDKHTTWKRTIQKTHIVPASLMELEEAQQETGAQGAFMVLGQHWDSSGPLTSMMPVKYVCILKLEKWSSLFYVQRVLQEWLRSSVILAKLSVIPVVEVNLETHSWRTKLLKINPLLVP